jgi:hypothetical protein
MTISKTVWALLFAALMSVCVCAQTVSLPQNWVSNTEYINTPSLSIVFPAAASGGSWNCGATNYGPYTANSLTSLQAAINNAEACRTATGNGVQITIPAGALFSNTTGLVLPQTAGDTSTKFIVLTSSTPLPLGRTVCSHGIQDNLATSVQPGIRNVGCSGASMNYQLGSTITKVTGAFTLANGTATNTSAYNDVASMWTVQCTQANCSVITTAVADTNNIGPHHYAILNAEIRPNAGLSSINPMVIIGRSTTETLVSQLPTHIHFAYDYIHGDWADAPVSGGVATGGATGANIVPNGMAFGCIGCSVAYSYFDKMLRPGNEGHVIYLGYAQQFKVVHNWIEGQSSGLFAGGYSSTISLAGVKFLDAQDVEDRGNRYTYPYSWILANDAGLCENGLVCSGHGYVRKNSHETKVANRYLFDGNILENVDNSGAQSGISNSWKVTNTTGNYFLVNQHLTMTNNLMRSTCQGGAWGFRSTTDVNNGGAISGPTQLAIWRNNLLYNVSLSNPGCAGVSPMIAFKLGNNYGSLIATTGSCSRDGAGAVSTCTAVEPTGIAAGDPVQVNSCVDTTFNTNPLSMGPLAVSPTVFDGATVAYLNSGTPSATTTGCVINNGQGWPRYLTYDHNTEIIDATGASTPYSVGGGSTWELSRNLAYTNGIAVGGGPNATFGEGTRTLTKGFDGTTLTFHHNAYPNRDGLAVCPGHTTPAAGGIAACYAEWDTIGVQTTPTTIWGTQTPNCSGASPDPTCIGFVGGLSTGSLSFNLSDYHGYTLATGSSFRAGQTFQANDGTDLGASISAIDAAQVATKYVCQSACGTGPFFDVPDQSTVGAPSRLIGAIQ